MYPFKFKCSCIRINRYLIEIENRYSNSTIVVFIFNINKFSFGSKTIKYDSHLTFESN